MNSVTLNAPLADGTAVQLDPVWYLQHNRAAMAELYAELRQNEPVQPPPSRPRSEIDRFRFGLNRARIDSFPSA